MDAGQVEEFTAAFAAAPDHRAVAELLGHAARALGFDHVALVHHSGAPEGEAGLALVDYPEAWRRSLGARRSFADDPVLVMSERRIAGFLWSELEQLMPLSERQREVLAIADRARTDSGGVFDVRSPEGRLDANGVVKGWAAQRAADCLVAAGLGVSMLPGSFRRTRVDGVVYRTLLDPGATSSVWLVRRRSERSPAALAFIELVTRGAAA